MLKLIERQGAADGQSRSPKRARATSCCAPVGQAARLQVAVTRLREMTSAPWRAGKAKFEDLAKEHSRPTAVPRRAATWAGPRPAMFVPEFEAAMGELAPLAISEPFQSQFGLHIVQVMERREVAVDPRQQREQLRGVLRERKFGDAYKEWVADLRAKAFIEMRDAPL
jgi:peptidyl-prolyl cis-trans isomerase SurA